MKKNILSAVAILFTGCTLFAQTDVSINIHHYLNGEPFAFNTPATNDIGHDFNVNRLEYYLSNFTIVHDGGQELSINDEFALVKADQETIINLGNYDVSIVEQLRFHVGVGPEYNHLDPASYPFDHPLAPHNPSMHWGWAAGYRFVAFEGNGGENLNQAIELHGLGNTNYFETTIDLGATSENGEIELNVDADCNRILEGIEVNSGVIVHGGDGAASASLENMRDFVFSATNGALNNRNLDFKAEVSIFPNPSTNGNFNVRISDVDAMENPRIEINNILGQTLYSENNIALQDEISHSINTAGIYLVNLYVGSTIVSSQKLIVQ